MKAWALKHKATGQWMPARMSRSSARGWSHWSPGYVHPEFGLAQIHDKNPRIFFTLQSARNALTAWAQGAWENTHSAGSYFEPPEDTGPAPMAPPAPRNRGDLDVVELRITGGGL